MKVFKKRRKTCYFTDNKVQKIDWKDADLLKRFISDRGKILPRRITGTKAIYQRELDTAIKRARHMALFTILEFIQFALQKLKNVHFYVRFILMHNNKNDIIDV